MKKNTKQILAFTIATLGLLSYPTLSQTKASTTQATMHPKVVKTTQRHISRETQLKDSVHHLAHQRKQYHHPSISWNFRDIGGYNTYGGHYHVKTGKIYLSSYINHINRHGANRLKKLHVHTDIDVRNYKYSPTSIKDRPQPGEMGLRKDRYHLHLRYLHYPVENSKQERKDWKKVPSKYKNDHYAETRRFRGEYDLTPLARHTYHNSLYAIMKYTKGKNAIMLNCNSGRDRSDCLASIILALLNVRQTTIEKNFLLTNYYYYQTSYKNQLNRIQAFYQTIKKHYGSVYGYARSKRGLNLSHHFINRFRNRFLIRH